MFINTVKHKSLTHTVETKNKYSTRQRTKHKRILNYFNIPDWYIYTMT